jgi:hypothetical protein
MTDDDERLSPLRWPLRWVRDETYWRQVSASTAAALIAGATTFLVKHSGANVPWWSVSLTVVGALAGSATIYGVWKMSDGLRKRRRLRKLRTELKKSQKRLETYDQDNRRSRVATKLPKRAILGKQILQAYIQHLQAEIQRIEASIERAR